ncbi:CpsB/CapC family capsule biosynthesis tyrosine phosphatase [Sporosarcina sp. FSL K6-1508]|uniref:CpsB/CapC family capsule biosynthesis tyrosine phosphatase n=1 Tax=Sporosarcina sp. FSL K6-1508 TaxID=2921553 RepID=UPI0030FA8F45
MKIILYEKLAIDLKSLPHPITKSDKYVLISIPDQKIPQFAYTVFFEMQLMGYIPIIAHAERNFELRNDNSILREFEKKGVLVHVAAESIIGMNGRENRKIAIKLCRKGLVHFISTASTGKNVSSPNLINAYHCLEKKIPSAIVESLKQNAEHLVDGTDFHPQFSIR